MFPFHPTSSTSYRPSCRSLIPFLLLLITVMPSAIAPASAASTIPTPVRDDETQGGNMEQPPQSGIPTDSTTSTPPSSTALKAAPAMLYQSGTNTTMFRWSSSGSSFLRYTSHWTIPTGYTLSRVGDRMVSGDFNGDGTDDIATAYDLGTVFRFHVWLSGVTYQGGSGWYEGPIDLDNAQGRLVAGDWDGDGLDDLALGYDYGNGTARIYRYRSTGSSFYHLTGDWVSNAGAYSLFRVGNRMVSGDFNGDGLDDIATAYQYTDFFRYHVWLSGVGYQNNWYESAVSLDNVQGRLVAGDWDGDGRDDLAIGRDHGNNTGRISRFRSNGSTFYHLTGDWGPSTYNFLRVGDRMAAGDVNGDGLDDIATAYQYTDFFRYHVWLSGVGYQNNWYESSSYNLDNAQGRFVLGRW